MGGVVPFIVYQPCYLLLSLKVTFYTSCMLKGDTNFGFDFGTLPTKHPIAQRLYRFISHRMGLEETPKFHKPVK